jgi:hypothetical protein
VTLKLGKVSRGPHLPTLVASSITREIAQGRLKPGDQLPTEQALASTFGVQPQCGAGGDRAAAVRGQGLDAAGARRLRLGIIPGKCSQDRT